MEGIPSRIVRHHKPLKLLRHDLLDLVRDIQKIEPRNQFQTILGFLGGSLLEFQNHRRTGQQFELRFEFFPPLPRSRHARNRLRIDPQRVIQALVTRPSASDCP